MTNITSIMLAVGSLVFSFATLALAVITDPRRRDKWGDRTDSWEAEQRRRRASIYGYESCPECGNVTVVDGQCRSCHYRGATK